MIDEFLFYVFWMIGVNWLIHGSFLIGKHVGMYPKLTLRDCVDCVLSGLFRSVIYSSPILVLLGVLIEVQT